MKNIYQKTISLIISFLILGLPVFVFAQDEPVPSSDPSEPVINLEDQVAAEPAMSPGQPDENAEVTVDVNAVEEPAMMEITPLSEASIPPIMIHVEQQAWNTFKFRPSYQLGVGDYEYEWDFGDGQKSNQRIVTHEFVKPGAFRVSLNLDGQGGTVTDNASIQIHVGFFNLANWRLWLLILILAAIIIVASLIAGISGKSEDNQPLPSAKKKITPKAAEPTDQEISIEPLSEKEGDFESMASTGLDKQELSEDLALLESLDNSSKTKGEDKEDITEPLTSAEEEIPEAKAEPKEAMEGVQMTGVDEEGLDKKLDELLAAETTPEREEKAKKPKKTKIKKESGKTKTKKTRTSKRKTKKK